MFSSINSANLHADCLESVVEDLCDLKQSLENTDGSSALENGMLEGVRAAYNILESKIYELSCKLGAMDNG